MHNLSIFVRNQRVRHHIYIDYCLDNLTATQCGKKQMLCRKYRKCCVDLLNQVKCDRTWPSCDRITCSTEATNGLGCEWSGHV